MEIWELAKPFGRPRKFKNAEQLWGAFLAYLKWNEQNPMTVNDLKKQRKAGMTDDKTQLRQTVERPLSLFGFRCHAGIKRDWCDFKNDYSNRSADFCGVIKNIEMAVRQQQVDNAITGNYKENIIARLNNINDTIEQRVTGQIAATAKVGMSQTEAREFLDKLEEKI